MIFHFRNFCNNSSLYQHNYSNFFEICNLYIFFTNYRKFKENIFMIKIYLRKINLSLPLDYHNNLMNYLFLMCFFIISSS